MSDQNEPTEGQDGPKELREYAERQKQDAADAKAENERLQRELSYARAGIDLESDEAKELFDKDISAETASKLLAGPPSGDGGDGQANEPGAEEQSIHDRINEAGGFQQIPQDPEGVSQLEAAFNEQGGMSPEQMEAWLRQAGYETGSTMADGGQMKPWSQF